VAQEFNLAFFGLAVKAGAHVLVDQAIPGAEEAYYKYAPDESLDFIPPCRKLVAETFDASLRVWADENTRSLAGIDPKRIARSPKAGAEISQTVMQRSAEGSYRWCVTVHPTPAMAQDANMSLADYTGFVYEAGKLNEADPVAFWRAEGKKQEELIAWLKGRKQVVLKGSNIDLALSIDGRAFAKSDGLYNFPDGEIFTSPVDVTARGWVRFKYPGIYDGQEVEDIELRFEGGKVVKEKASNNQALLTSLLNTDDGARRLGEWGIGTNYGITRFSCNMLFDEKIGGTVHFAVGQSFPECGGKNESGLHWDMLCDMADSEIKIDGDLFYKNGKFALT
jgi:aminopeptidase